MDIYKRNSVNADTYLNKLPISIQEKINEYLSNKKKLTKSVRNEIILSQNPTHSDLKYILNDDPITQQDMSELALNKETLTEELKQIETLQKGINPLLLQIQKDVYNQLISMQGGKRKSKKRKSKKRKSKKYVNYKN